MGPCRRALNRSSGVAVIGLLLGGCMSDIPFETIDRGTSSGYQEQAALVIRSEERWREVWEQHRAVTMPPPSPPQIDLDQEMVIAVFLGARPTGGFGIEIKRITQRGQALRVLVEETAPDPKALVTQALTFPSHLVRIRRFVLPVEFEFHRTPPHP